MEPVKQIQEPLKNFIMVSIIVAVMEEKGLDTIFTLLDSFFPQEGDIDYEFIVVDEYNKQREKIYQDQFPWVTLIQTERLMPESYARNIALRHARGKFIAFTTDHCIFPRHYIKNLVAEFSKGYRIVGGPVTNANPEIFTGWVQYFCEYNKWIPGLPDGEIDDLPGCNFAYHAELLRKLGPLPEGGYSTETLFHQKAKEADNKLYFFRGLEIKHTNEVHLPVIWKERFYYGRLFAARRGFALWRRIVYIILSPVIALTEYLRILNHARRNLQYLKKFIHCTPLLLPTLFIWMAGECIGYARNKQDKNDYSPC
ncbi:MAG: glycosyltransferase [Candidatus Brocadia sp.]|nr:glycosyltransferase [Candidatus Brocadia sp.]MDG6025813.1 glycosyltransferase [Candidatus Brocadia sp.]